MSKYGVLLLSFSPLTVRPNTLLLPLPWSLITSYIMPLGMTDSTEVAMVEVYSIISIMDGAYNIFKVHLRYKLYKQHFLLCEGLFYNQIVRPVMPCHSHLHNYKEDHLGCSSSLKNAQVPRRSLSLVLTASFPMCNYS